MASGSKSFSPLTKWLDLSATADSIDTTNTTRASYMFLDATQDGAADLVFFDSEARRLAFYESNRANALINGTRSAVTAHVTHST